MKQVIVVSLLSTYLFCGDNHKLFLEANQMYINENYNRSIEIYESIIRSDLTNDSTKIVNTKTSKYNTDVYIDECQICKKYKHVKMTKCKMSNIQNV